MIRKLVGRAIPYGDDLLSVAGLGSVAAGFWVAFGLAAGLWACGGAAIIAGYLVRDA